MMANYFPFYLYAVSFFGPKEPVLLTPLFNEPFALGKFSTYLFEFFTSRLMALGFCSLTLKTKIETRTIFHLL